MEIRVLRYFLMVAREENITKAASLLHITQPTLSRQLMQLEEELGVTLFHRSKYRIVLTEDGMLLKRRAQEIIELYTYRWDIEVSYKTLKTGQEIERHISSDGDVARNDIYAKVLFHNIAGIMRKELNRSLEMKESNRQYVVNIAQLHEIIHDVNILLSMINGKKRQLKKKIEQIEKMLDKIKVPVRPNRHYQRWGRVMISPPSYRFRLDGRNNPKVRRYKSVLMTISP